MATVSTSTGTYLNDLFNPQVIADLIDTKLTDNIVFAPLARVDTTLEGRAGNTVTLPYYSFIGGAELVEEGHDIPIKQLNQSTKQVEIVKYGVGVQLTDEALLSGYGDPAGEASNQIVKAIADSVDKQLLASLDTNDVHVYNSDNLAPADIATALAGFGEETDDPKVLICDAAFYAKCLKSDWIPASQIAAEVKIRGALGMIYGCQVIVSNRVSGKNFYIVKQGALALFMKRETTVETDRDIVNQSNVIVGSKLFAPYLLNASKAIKIVNGIDSSLPVIGLTAAAGTAAGDTALTVSDYTPGDGESYKYTVGDKADKVVAGQEFTGTSWNGSADITAAAGKVITVVSVKSGKAVAAGTVVSVPHA